jgi:hypothetical protein
MIEQPIRKLDEMIELMTVKLKPKVGKAGRKPAKKAEKKTVDKSPVPAK